MEWTQISSFIEDLQIAKCRSTHNYLFCGSSELKELKWQSSAAVCIPATKIRKKITRMLGLKALLLLKIINITNTTNK